MADPLADYETAADGFAAELARTGDDLSGRSPCEGWSAKDVIDHVLAGTADVARGLGATLPDIPEGTDVPTRYTLLRAALVEAARAPGALEKLVPSPIGSEVPAAVLLGIFSSDALVHTSDLARANGHDVELDADLLRRTVEGVVAVEQFVRKPGVFGPAVEPPEGATEQQRALCFLGRRA